MCMLYGLVMYKDVQEGRSRRNSKNDNRGHTGNNKILEKKCLNLHSVDQISNQHY